MKFKFLISILILLVSSGTNGYRSGKSGSNIKSLQVQLNNELSNIMANKVSMPKNTNIECDKSQSNVRKTTDNGFMINKMASMAFNFARLDSTITVRSQFCPFEKIACDPNYKYRSVDGQCNNLDNPLRGAANTPYKRILPPSYEDGIDAIRSRGVSGDPLPHPRSISLIVSPPSKNKFEREITQVFPIFGQFFIHDAALTSATTDENGMEIECPCESTDPVCIPLEWPKNDQFLDQKCMKFTRSSATFPDFECSINYREQLNLLSAFLDGSAIYGMNTDRATQLRTFSNGMLKTSEPSIGKRKPVLNGTYLPLADDTCGSDSGRVFNCFLAGEVRTSENLALVSMHTLFMREHNRIADVLGGNNPSWSDEEIYQEARRIVVSILQHIVYSEWLPIVIGEDSLSPDLTKTEYYTGYDSNINPAIANEFSTAAFRFGHSLIRDQFTRYDENDDRIKKINFTDMSFKSDLAYNKKGQGIQSILRGMVTDKCKKFGSFGFELQNKLFGKIENNEFTAIDLLSANIQRGRDHGLRPYVEYVKICHGITVNNFDDLLPLTSQENIELLRTAYQNVADIDLFPGGLLENKIKPLGLVSPTFGCIIKSQLSELKNGDRFYYENGPSVNPSAFSLDQLAEIKKVTLSGLICNNYDLTSMPRRVFFLPSFENPKVACDYLKNQIDLNLWTGIF